MTPELCYFKQDSCICCLTLVFEEIGKRGHICVVRGGGGDVGDGNVL